MFSFSLYLTQGRVNGDANRGTGTERAQAMQDRLEREYRAASSAYQDGCTFGRKVCRTWPESSRQGTLHICQQVAADATLPETDRRWAEGFCDVVTRWIDGLGA